MSSRTDKASTTRGPVFGFGGGGGGDQAGCCGYVDCWPLRLDPDGTLTTMPFLRTEDNSTLYDEKGDLLYEGDPANINTFPVAPHAATHQDGGSDELNVTGLSGLLADAQTPLAHTHVEADITDLDKYDQATVDAKDTAILQTVADNFSVAAYGAMAGLDGGQPSSLGGAWIPIDWYAVEDIAGDGITLDPANGTFAFDFRGVFAISVYLNWEHNSSNSGRITNLRLFNVTTGTPESGIVVGTGRNQEATNVGVSFLTEVEGPEIGQLWRLEIGNGDTYSSVNWVATSIDINMESEWREPLP